TSSVEHSLIFVRASLIVAPRFAMSPLTPKLPNRNVVKSERCSTYKNNIGYSETRSIRRPSGFGLSDICLRSGRTDMLRREHNASLTQPGPQPAMGDFFRCYWIPALLAEELPENDSPPVRIKLLSERLLAFRDSQGRYGLIDEFCAHRGVSLWFGRNEE